MLGTVALVVVFTLTALVVVLYAAYCEAGEDLPCKKTRKKTRRKTRKKTTLSSSGVATTHQKGSP